MLGIIIRSKRTDFVVIARGLSCTTTTRSRSIEENEAPLSIWMVRLSTHSAETISNECHESSADQRKTLTNAVLGYRIGKNYILRSTNLSVNDRLLSCRQHHL